MPQLALNTFFPTVIQLNPDEIWPIAGQATAMAVEAPLRGETATAATLARNSQEILYLYLALTTKRTFLRVTSFKTFLDGPGVALDVTPPFLE